MTGTGDRHPSDEDSTALPVGDHHPDEHDGHTNHEHGSETLGPIDVRAWSLALAGLIVGLLVAGALYLAVSG